MELSTLHLIGLILTIVVVFGIGIYSGRKIKSAADFSVSSRGAGSILVMGTLLGTLVGGASTVGTAQMAYLYGFSAWWFTLGGGIACVLIGLFLAGPMRKTTFETIPQFLAAGYGTPAGVIATLFVSLGMFINVIPQIFSSSAMLTSMFSLSVRAAAFYTVIMITLYVVFGGLWGTGMMGLSKILLTCIGMLSVGVLAYLYMGRAAGLREVFPPYPWFSLFGRGVNTDLAAGFSLLVGVLSSQIYFQALFAGRDLQAARRGAFLSAVLAPAIGLGGIMVGLYMRANFPGINPAQALPLFVIQHLPPWFAGVVLATLLLASIGTAAGLTLGISTMLTRDIISKVLPRVQDRQVLCWFRLVIVGVMLLALVIVYAAGENMLILQWSYLSQGIRGATVCFPLLAAIFLKNKISSRAGILAVLLGPVSVIAGGLLRLPVNSLYIGLLVSLVILVADYLANRKKAIASL